MKEMALVITALLTIYGCAAKESKEAPAERPYRTKIQICPEPRPEMCTQQYEPVCGQFSRGGSKTYSNWCSACSDKTVESYAPGECR